MQVYINGEYFEKADAKISVFDHGLLYGDGVFEGIRVYDNKIFRSEEHTSELQSHSFISYAVFCLKKKKKK